MPGHFEIRKSRRDQFHWIEIDEDGEHINVGDERFDKMQPALDDAFKHGAQAPVGYIGRPHDKVYD